MTIAPESDCTTCGTTRVRDASGTLSVDIEKTTDALVERVRSGEMRYVRGDVPLEDMLALAESDLKYTIVSFLECGACGRTWFWGLCIRAQPILKVVEPTAPASWRWGEVPPRHLWA